jgi:uncharacterized membrane-anchored protein YhcB (DUF1043 family)
MAQAWKWGITVGVLIGFVGLILLAAAYASQSTSEDMLASGLVIFAVGILIMSVSFYIRANSLHSQQKVESGSSALSSGKQRKLICDVCHKSAAVIQCTMHKTVLCPGCLAGHYESRGCVYVPTVRRTSVKTARGAVAARS